MAQTIFANNKAAASKQLATSLLKDVPLLNKFSTTKGNTMSKDEKAVEAEIQAKGLNAPRLSPEKIDAVIVNEDYHIFPGTTLTVCCLTLVNGFTVTGESAAASPENFDVEIGKKIAKTNARDKIWALEGYALRTNLANR